MSCDTYWWLLSFFFFPLPSPSYTHMPSELMRGSCTLTPAFGVTDWLVAPLAARCSATAPLHALCTVCKRLWEGRVWRPALQPYLLKRLMPLSASQSATSGSSFFFRKHFFFLLHSSRGALQLWALHCQAFCSQAYRSCSLQFWAYVIKPFVRPNLVANDGFLCVTCTEYEIFLIPLMLLWTMVNTTCIGNVPCEAGFNANDEAGLEKPCFMPDC